jgi:transposase
VRGRYSRLNGSAAKKISLQAAISQFNGNIDLIDLSRNRCLIPKGNMTLEEKVWIIAEVEQLGASFADVARRHAVSRGLLWNWRRQVRSGELLPEATPIFVPVQITAEPPIVDCPPAAMPVPSPSKTAVPSEAARIQIAPPFLE